MKRNDGFSLIEVLISALIIVASISALVKLQAITFRSFEKTQLHQSAVMLAQEKLDDLRHFDSIHSLQNQLAYTDIQTNMGGEISAGNRTISINPRQKIRQVYKLNWEVKDQYFVDSNNDIYADLWVDKNHILTPSPLPNFADRKHVSVNVTWQYRDKEQTFALAGLVSPTPLNRMYTSHFLSNYHYEKPIVTSSFRLAPTPIAIQSNISMSQRIFQSPQARDFGSPGRKTVIERANIKTQQTISRHEFRTLACICRYEGIGQGKSPAIHRVINNDQLSLEKGEWLTKEVASALPNQDPLCSICCRDHHASHQMNEQQRTFIVSDSQPHKHYFKNEDSSFELASNIGDEYQEMCRFIRNDGDYELTNDWHAIDMIAIAHNQSTPSQISRYRLRFEDNLLTALLDTEPNLQHQPPGITGANLDVQLRNITLYVDPLLPEDTEKLLSKHKNNDDTWPSMVPFYVIDTSIQTTWKSEFPSLVSISNEGPSGMFAPEEQQFPHSNKGRVIGLETGVSAMLTSLNRGNPGILGLDPIVPVGTENTLLRSHPLIDNIKEKEKYNITGLVYCIDARTDAQSPCSEARDIDYVSLLSSVTIRLDTIVSPCELTIAMSHATGYFVCHSVDTGWHGDLIADASQTKMSVETYWLLPNSKKIDSAKVSNSMLIVGDPQQPLRLIVRLLKG